MLFIVVPAGILTVSKLGSAPLFARKNLPSLEPSPCGSLASVTAWSAILAVLTALDDNAVVVTALSAILAEVTASSAILAVLTALLDNLSVVISPLSILSAVTALAPNLTLVISPLSL